MNEKAEVIKVTQRMKSMGSLLSALADIVHKSNLDGFRFIPYCFWWSLPISTLSKGLSKIYLLRWFMTFCVPKKVSLGQKVSRTTG